MHCLIPSMQLNASTVWTLSQAASHRNSPMHPEKWISTCSKRKRESYVARIGDARKLLPPRIAQVGSLTSMSTSERAFSNGDRNDRHQPSGEGTRSSVVSADRSWRPRRSVHDHLNTAPTALHFDRKTPSRDRERRCSGEEIQLSLLLLPLKGLSAMSYADGSLATDPGSAIRPPRTLRFATDSHATWPVKSAGAYLADQRQSRESRWMCKWRVGMIQADWTGSLCSHACRWLGAKNACKHPRPESFILRPSSSSLACLTFEYIRAHRVLSSLLDT